MYFIYNQLISKHFFFQRNHDHWIPVIMVIMVTALVSYLSNFIPWTYLVLFAYYWLHYSSLNYPKWYFNFKMSCKIKNCILYWRSSSAWFCVLLKLVFVLLLKPKQQILFVCLSIYCLYAYPYISLISTTTIAILTVSKILSSSIHLRVTWPY